MTLVVDCFKLVRGAGKSIGIYNLALNLVRNLVEEKERTKDSEIKQCKIVVLGNAYNEQEFNIPGVEFAHVITENSFRAHILVGFFVVTII